MPASVLVGLALLPFVVPLLWIIGPMVLHQPPMLSLATPIALAIAASALCLAVVYTIDWTPMTRVKGVLMIVGLSYFTGMSLYFLKKEMVDKAREIVGPERNWKQFQPPGSDYRVRMPANSPPKEINPLPAQNLKSHQRTHSTLTGPITFTVGMAPDPKPAKADDEEEWFAAILKAIKDGGTGEPREIKTLQPAPNTGPGRQYEFRLGQKMLVVRIYRASGRFYYLSAESQFHDSDDSLILHFFESFQVLK